LENHWVNFIEAVRSRRTENLNCSIEAASQVATVAQMGNISFRSGQRLAWDKSAEKFTDENINRQYMMKEYQNGYKLPSL
jgi:hypothetical protein